MTELIHSLENQEEEEGSDKLLFPDHHDARDDDYPGFPRPESDAFLPLPKEKKCRNK